jgi:DegV family protein with EDD domain
MKISYLDGPRLRLALTAGSHSLMRNIASLNAINVFPVPDGDTGTNMASTARAISASLATFRPRNAGSVLKKVAESALAAAKGNSGAILAQFFLALAEELGHEARISAKRFAGAAVLAAEKTRRALSVPKEGTILTVLHDWAHALREKAQQSDDILHVFTAAYESAKTSLAKTKDVLPEMRRAGVVDAGAKGFVHMLEGIAQFIRSGSLRETLRADRRHAASGVPAPEALAEAQSDTEIHPEFEILADADNAAFRYCAEALVHGEKLDLDAIKAELAAFGDSIVVAGTKSLAKVHVHTDSPSDAFDMLDSRGIVEAHKIDDMRLQARLARRAQSTRGCSIVTDTGCDLPESFLLDHGVLKVPALITIDGKVRPDGPALSVQNLCRLMKERPDFSMSTSQPTDVSFSRAFALALAYSKEILYIGLTSALSGTFQAGVRAARSLGGQIVAFDSRTVTSAQGLLVRRAVEMAEQGRGAQEIVGELEGLQKRLVFFVAVRDLSSLIRSGRLHGVKSLILRKFGLRPLLATNQEGRARTAGIYAGERNTVSALFSKVKKAFPAGSSVELHISHVDAETDARHLAELCAARFHSDSMIVISEMGPVLASLAWRGALSVAGLPLEE